MGQLGERLTAKVGSALAGEYRPHPTRWWWADFAVPERRLLVGYDGSMRGQHAVGHRIVGGRLAADDKGNTGATRGWTVLVATAKTVGDGRFTLWPTTSCGGRTPRGEEGEMSERSGYVIAEIGIERARQVQEDEWTPGHDDRHGRCEMAQAARAQGVSPSASRIRSASAWKPAVE